MDSDNKELAKAIRELAKGHVESMGKLSEALGSVAHHLKYLGNGDASTSMGALENLSMQVQEGMESIAASIRRVADRSSD